MPGTADKRPQKNAQDQIRARIDGWLKREWPELAEMMTKESNGHIPADDVPPAQIPLVALVGDEHLPVQGLNRRTDLSDE